MQLKIKNSQTDLIDITPYIAFGGIKWQREDIDGTNAGRTLSGEMQRDRVATKIRMDITCRPLKAAELNTILNLIYPEYIYVTYTDPMYGTRSLVEFYSNNNPASYCMLKPDGTEWWEGVTFPLIER